MPPEKTPPEFELGATRINPDDRREGPRIRPDPDGAAAFDPTVLLGAKPEEFRHIAVRTPGDPAVVASWGLAFPGAGFFAAGHRMTAFFAFIFTASPAVLFVARTGFFPSLDFLTLAPAPAPELFFWAGCSAVLWWLGAVVPVGLITRKLSPDYHRPRKPLALLITSPIPALGQYVQGKFRRGDILSLLFLSFAFSSVSLFSVWKRSPFPSARDTVDLDRWLPLVGVFALLSFLALTAGVLSAFLGALSTARHPGHEEKRPRSDRKFVVLGTAVIATLAVLAAAGAPGRYAGRETTRVVQVLKERGFMQTAARLETGISSFQSRIDLLRDCMEVLK